MDKFYCIKLIAPNGDRGYVMETPKGISLVSGNLHPDITKFDTYQDAQQYMRDKKLERHGVKAYIRDNEDLMKEFAGSLSQARGAYCVQDAVGRKLFFDSAKNGYYFDTKDVGYCAWPNEKQCTEFIKAYKLDAFAKPIINEREN